MPQLKRNEEEDDWKDSVHKYQEAHEEIVRRKKEDKQVEEALFQVVTKKQIHMQFSDNQAIIRKQSMKKLFGFLKFGKNKK